MNYHPRYWDPKFTPKANAQEQAQRAKMAAASQRDTICLAQLAQDPSISWMPPICNYEEESAASVQAALTNLALSKESTRFPSKVWQRGKSTQYLRNPMGRPFVTRENLRSICEEIYRGNHCNDDYITDTDEEIVSQADYMEAVEKVIEHNMQTRVLAGVSSIGNWFKKLPQPEWYLNERMLVLSAQDLGLTAYYCSPSRPQGPYCIPLPI